MRPITVVIADPEEARRAACLSLLQPEKGIRVVREARSGLEAFAAVAKLKPRILLLDLKVSLGHGVALLPVLRQKSPGTKVILLTGRASEVRILDALSHGARGYLEKKGLQTFLPKAVRVVDAGEAWVPRKMVAKLLDRLARLTAREEGRREATGREAIGLKSHRRKFAENAAQAYRRAESHGNQASDIGTCR